MFEAIRGLCRGPEKQQRNKKSNQQLCKNSFLHHTSRVAGNEGRFRKFKLIIPISEYYEQQRRKLITEIIDATRDDPIKKVCVDDQLHLVEHDGKRIGRPRNNGLINAVLNYWEYLRRNQFKGISMEFNFNNPAHVATIKRAVEQQFGRE